MVHNGVILWCGDVKDMDKSDVPEVHQFVHGLAEETLHKFQPMRKKAASGARRGQLCLPTMRGRLSQMGRQM